MHATLPLALLLGHLALCLACLSSATASGSCANTLLPQLADRPICRVPRSLYSNQSHAQRLRFSLDDVRIRGPGEDEHGFVAPLRTGTASTPGHTYRRLRHVTLDLSVPLQRVHPVLGRGLVTVRTRTNRDRQSPAP
jgi:hypothetical protein